LFAAGDIIAKYTVAPAAVTPRKPISATLRETLMSLEIKLKKIKKIPVLELIGRAIDVDVEKFSKKLQGIYKKGAGCIVIDLTKTNFVDSHGLGIIIYYNTLMEKEGKKLVILNQNPDDRSYVRRLFELTNLDKVLRTVTSIDQV
jgi:anti-anti-sigma factor